METGKAEKVSVMIDLERACANIFENVAAEKNFDITTAADNVTYIDDRTTKAFKQFRDGFFGAVLVLGCRPEATGRTQEAMDIHHRMGVRGTAQSGFRPPGARRPLQSL